MKEKEFKTPERKQKTTTTKIADFLTTTGFILEMEISELLKKNGYRVSVNKYFFDYDENKKREIDIIALKEINQIDVTLVIECKQNANLDWIFVCSDKSPGRFYNYIKYFPKMSYDKSITKTGVFDHLRQLDHKLPLAQNSTIRHVSGKQQESKEIYECLTRLPKAMVGVVEGTGVSKDKRNIFFPVVVFSGQIFTAEYENKLKVIETNAVQHAAELDTDNYKYHRSNNLYSFDRSSNEMEKKNSPVAEIALELGSKYLIDFITQKGIKNFLADIEKRISKIDLDLWPIDKKAP
jgi:hypothetical protein